MDLTLYSKRIEELLAEARGVERTAYFEKGHISGPASLDEEKFTAWQARTQNFFELYLGRDHSITQKFTDKVQYGVKTEVTVGVGLLEAAKDARPSFVSNEAGLLSIDSLTRILENFHRCARQIRKRHNSRETLDVQDEYDVQDLLHAILVAHADDVRAEEWTPSYGGSASRMDFLLKKEKVVIEVKMTRKNLKGGEVGSQLIIDRARYQTHNDCKHLVCFVYDPDGYIQNPRGIESDLSVATDDFRVTVIIAPK